MYRTTTFIALFLLIIGIVLTGCNFQTQPNTPTAEGIFEEPINPQPEVDESTATATASVTPSPTLSPTPQEVVQVITLPPSPTNIPTATTIPTATLGPWEYVVQPNDTLGFIIQQAPFNYRSFDVFNEIVRINDNMLSADDLPPPGETIFIPRPTQIPMVTGLEGTPSAAGGSGERLVSTVVANAEIGCHQIREGETVISITQQYGGLTLEILSQLNPDLNFFGCSFEEPGGGPDCAVFIIEGTCINVPLPTPTPTLSPTPSGNETATSTPTPRAPNLVSPPEGGIARGAVILYWDSVGILEADEYYLVQVTDITTEEVWTQVTKNTNIRIDDSFIPSDGQTHEISWSVSIAKANPAGGYVPVGQPGFRRTFMWESR